MGRAPKSSKDIAHDREPRDRGSDEDKVPMFDEGEPNPAPIQSTGNDNVRSAPPSDSASTSKQREDEREKHTEATMPPGEGMDPKRHTL